MLGFLLIDRHFCLQNGGQSEHSENGAFFNLDRGDTRPAV
jgi:hypothetical protein